MLGKTVKIINIENATEKQKKQKLELKLEIAAMCAVIVAAGISFYPKNTSSGVGKEYKEKVLTEDNDPNEITNFNFQEETLVNGEWIKSGMFVTTDNNTIPQDTADKRYTFVGYSSSGIISDSVEDKKMTDKADSVFQEETLIDGEWIKSGMFITTDNNTIPQNTANKKYTFVGYSSKMVFDDVKNNSSGKVR